MAKRQIGNMWTLGLVGFVAILLVVALVFSRPITSWLSVVIRMAALLGYLCVFTGILFSAFMRRIRAWFGHPYIKVHHTVVVTGLVLITVHPLTVAWSWASARAFVPTLSSWSAFIQFGGQPAWYLFGLASLAAVLRKSIGRNWKSIHVANYVAFWLVTTHGILIGTDVQQLGIKVLFVLAALVVLGVLVQKRLPRKRRVS